MEDAADNNCCICREPLEATNWTCPQCRKHIHAHCIIGAVEHDHHGQRCPLCRADITESLREICGNDVPFGSVGAGDGDGSIGVAIDEAMLRRLLSADNRRLRAIPIVVGYFACVRSLMDLLPALAPALQNPMLLLDMITYVIRHLHVGTSERRQREERLYAHNDVPRRIARHSNDSPSGSYVNELCVHRIIDAIHAGFRLTQDHYDEHNATVMAAGAAHKETCDVLRECLVWLRIVLPCDIA